VQCGIKSRHTDGSVVFVKSVPSTGMGQLVSAERCCAGEDGSSELTNTLNLDPSTVSTGGVIVNAAQNMVMVQAANGKENADIVRFKVALSKASGENFGLAHMPMEDGSQSLLVVELRSDGPISTWNMEQRALGRGDIDVRRGDRIVSVGYVSDIDGMRELLRQDQVEFSVERWPPSVAVVLNKREPTDKYGMQTDLLIRDDGSKVLRVGRISGGLLGEWNTSAAAARRFYDVVGQFSEIVRVNDQKDDPERMQQMLVTESMVEVSFVRPDPELYNS